MVAGRADSAVSTRDPLGMTCSHLHDTTTEYDHGEKLLTFLVFCSECGTTKVVETLRYEPEFRAAAPLQAPAA